MRMVYASEVQEELEFAKQAADAFSKNPVWQTWTEAGPTPGKLMALRWGAGDDCVLVVRLDANHTPTNYQEII